MTAKMTDATLELLQAKFSQKTLEIAAPFIEKFSAIGVVDLPTLTDFLILLELYLEGTPPYIEADKIRALNNEDSHIVLFESTAAHRASGQNLLDRLTVVKLNGGLGTSMGCHGAKSAILINKTQTFLGAIAHQLESLGSRYGVSLPLWLLNSFYTQSDTAKLLAGFAYHELIQHQFPRLDIRNPQRPVPLLVKEEPKAEWYPPGHGDIYTIFSKFDWIETQLREGKAFCFISNADNLGATVDTGILGYMQEAELDFVMETTPKTKADIKGGSVIEEGDGHLALLEIAQVDPQDPGAISAFQNLPIFNTNNIWIRLTALQKILSEGLRPTLIQNRKTVHGVPVLQLEHAMGAAISAFERSATIVVPRTRFIPVKTTADLWVLRSDIYLKSENGFVSPNPKRDPALGVPLVQLSAEFHTVSELERRIDPDTSLLAVNVLIISGDVCIEKNVGLRDRIEIKVEQGCQLTIAPGTTLENATIQVPGTLPHGLKLVQNQPNQFVLTNA
jgi:UTP--glucose-1-phosphate uridylyltransferase